MKITDAERSKYEAMWAVDDYRSFSPGEEWREMFLDFVGDTRGRLLDAGCGTGRVGQQLAADGFDVTLCDMVSGALEADLPFFEQCLWQPIAGTYDVGYCCDVMEHIPTELSMLVVSRLLDACDRVFFTIATEPDAFGVRIGESLHLTVQPFAWWRDRLREVGTVLDARDCGNTAVFWMRRRGGTD